jgi:hypothetical protein
MVEDDYVVFALPKQYESRTTEMEFRADLRDGRLFGKTTLDDGREAEWGGVPAPALPLRDVEFGDPISLIGPDLANWRARTAGADNHWKVEGGVLVNGGVGTDLVTAETFSDFRLEAEYTYPANSNSGIYLRGRYEFQILDDYESGANGVGNSGAIYGFLAPTENVIRRPNEWNEVRIDLVGRWITVVLNGTTILDRQEIPGITGGALDSAEGEPGPIFLQGDHGPVSFRKLTIAPAL